MVKIIVEYVVPGDEYNRMEYSVVDSRSESTEDILKALKDYGLSWEIEDEDCYIHIISRTIWGKELINLKEERK